MTPEESFELTIMFFGLTNSLAMFQTMMNEILWDLINTGKVVSFIDDVIEEEAGHDKVVEEIVKRLVSELLKVDLIFISPFHFYFIFSFIFDLFSIFRTRVRVKGTRSRCHTAGHIR